mgnify:CR=1 FL=1
MRNKLNKYVVCKDGFTMSVQASEYSYCSPRINGAERYLSVEVGFPSEKEELLMEWAEDPETPTNTVYPFVPAQTVALVCAKHGGITEGNAPPGVPHLWAMEKGLKVISGDVEENEE